MVGTTIPHEALGVYGAGKVLLKPAEEGTGVGSLEDLYVELLSLQAVVISVRNPWLQTIPINMVRATIEGFFLSLHTAEEYARLRGKTAEEIFDRRLFHG